MAESATIETRSEAEKIDGTASFWQQQIELAHKDCKDFIADGQAVVKRFAERASDNAKKVRDGKYGTNELIEDAEWFWKNLGDDAVAGIEIFRSKPPASST